MVVLVERLEVAAEQVREVRKSVQIEGQRYRLDIALQAIQSTISLLKSPDFRTDGDAEPAEKNHVWSPIPVIWSRPRKGQRFEGHLLESGKIRLLDGRGPFTPSGACQALVKGFFNGWREWKYWDEGQAGGGQWLPIGELRAAGCFE